MNNHNWDNDFPRTPKSFHDRLCNTVAQLPNKEEITMSKKMSFKRTIVFAVIAIMVLATTASAVGRLYSTVSHSSEKDMFTEMPTTAKAQKIIKSSPKLVGKFQNAYEFTNGHTVQSQDTDDKGNVISKYNSLSLTYSNGTNDLWLDIQKYNSTQAIDNSDSQIVYKDITIDEVSFINKIVPLDYEMTEQDKLDQASGKVNFASAGGTTTEIINVKMVIWVDGDTRYSLMGMDNPISVDELMTMAKEIIDQK